APDGPGAGCGRAGRRGTRFAQPPLRVSTTGSGKKGPLRMNVDHRETTPSIFGTYVLPLLLVGLGLGPTLFLHPLLERSTFLLFTAAVVVSAAVGGLRAGLLATLASVVCTLLFIEPHHFWLEGGELVRLGTFVLVSLWGSALA